MKSEILVLPVYGSTAPVYGLFARIPGQEVEALPGNCANPYLPKSGLYLATISFPFIFQASQRISILPFGQAKISPTTQLRLIGLRCVEQFLQEISFWTIVNGVAVSGFHRIEECKTIMVLGSQDKVLSSCFSEQINPFFGVPG